MLRKIRFLLRVAWLGIRRNLQELDESARVRTDRYMHGGNDKRVYQASARDSRDVPLIELKHAILLLIRITHQLACSVVGSCAHDLTTQTLIWFKERVGRSTITLPYRCSTLRVQHRTLLFRIRNRSRSLHPSTFLTFPTSRLSFYLNRISFKFVSKKISSVRFSKSLELIILNGIKLLPNIILSNECNYK